MLLWVFSSTQTKTQKKPVLRGLSPSCIFLSLLRVLRKSTDEADFCLMRERKRRRKKNLGNPLPLYCLYIFMSKGHKVTFGTQFGAFLIKMVKWCLKLMQTGLLSGLLASSKCQPQILQAILGFKCPVEFNHTLLSIW